MVFSLYSYIMTYIPGKITPATRGDPTETLEFSNVPVERRGRNPMRDIIVGTPGPTPEARTATTPLLAFQLFFTIEIMEHIMEYTNRKIRHALQIQPGKYSYQKEIQDITELWAYFGLKIYRGLASM